MDRISLLRVEKGKLTKIPDFFFREIFPRTPEKKIALSKSSTKEDSFNW